MIGEVAIAYVEREDPSTHRDIRVVTGLHLVAAVCFWQGDSAVLTRCGQRIGTADIWPRSSPSIPPEAICEECR